MAHEVVKRVGARAYRYRVESYRDPATKKVRSRWTYLGRVASEGAPEAKPLLGVRRRRPQTPERLIDALERLLENASYGEVTAGAVAREAGLGHGTFYRYFDDKRAALLAAVERLRDEFDRVLPSFQPPFADAAAERARLRSWVAALLGKPSAHGGLLRAYLDALEADGELRERRLERRSHRTSALVAYLVALDAAGTITLPNPEPLAGALIALLDATVRAAIVAGVAPDTATVSGVSDAFERAIFGAVSSRDACEAADRQPQTMVVGRGNGPSGKGSAWS